MQLKRKQTLRAGAGLLTALSVLILGCNPASFTPGQGGNPAAPGQPGAQPLKFSALSGTAELDGEPLKDAIITVVDALNNEPASIIASGGGNIIASGGGNLTVKDAGLKTDAAGNFSLDVAGLEPGAVAKVMISKADGTTLSALVSGDEAQPGQYRISQFASLNVNVLSTLRAETITPLLQVTRVVRREQRVDVLRDLLVRTRQFDFSRVDQVARRAVLLQLRPPVYRNITIAIPTPPPPPNPTVTLTQTLNNIVQQSGLQSSFQDVTNNVIRTVAQQTQDANNREPNQTFANLNNTQLIGTDLTVNINGNNIQIGDTVIDATPVIVNATPAPTTAPTAAPTTAPTTAPTAAPTAAPTPAPASTPTSTDGTIKSDANAFDPTLTFGNNGIKVVQAQGQEDVGSVYARMTTTDVLSLPAWSSFDLSTSSSALLGTSTTTKPVTTATSTSAVPSRTLPSHLGSISVSDANDVYHKDLKVGTTTVATFTVYEVSGYYILGVVYKLSDAVKITGGHTSKLILPTGTTFKTDAEVKYVLYSRTINTVQGTGKITASAI